MALQCRTSSYNHPLRQLPLRNTVSYLPRDSVRSVACRYELTIMHAPSVLVKLSCTVTTPSDSSLVPAMVLRIADQKKPYGAG